MKICKHIIQRGRSSIPAAGGDFCIYCAEEHIEEIKCDRKDCETEGIHFHADDAERYLNSPEFKPDSL